MSSAFRQETEETSAAPTFPGSLFHVPSPRRGILRPVLRTAKSFMPLSSTWTTKDRENIKQSMREVFNITTAAATWRRYISSKSCIRSFFPFVTLFSNICGLYEHRTIRTLSGLCCYLISNKLNLVPFPASLTGIIYPLAIFIWSVPFKQSSFFTFWQTSFISTTQIPHLARQLYSFSLHCPI